MHRRPFLASTGGTLATAVGGCLGDRRPAGTDVDEAEPTADHHEGRVVEEDSQTDTPPHRIDRPAEPTDLEDPDWNGAYLGEDMDREPSLPFETIAVPVGRIENASFDRVDGPDDDTYRARLVADADAYDAVFEEETMTTATQNRLSRVDFDDAVLVVVECGLGSSSVTQRWVRAEADDGIVHLHGYETDPFGQVDDLAPHLSVLEIERPASALEFVRVSLTVSDSQRVHFNSTEGLVDVGREGEPRQRPSLFAGE